MRGLYGAVRFVGAAEAVGLHPVIGLEIELLDPAVADPGRIVVAPRRARRRPRRREDGTSPLADPVAEGVPTRPRPERMRLPGHREPVKEDLRGIGERGRGTASRAARPVRDRVAEPVPADLAGEHGRDQGRAAVQPGAPGRAYGGPRRPVRLSRRGARAPPAGGRPAGRARRRGAVRDRSSGGARRQRPAASSSSSRTTCSPTTTGSSPRPWRSRTSSACRSSSPTTSTTPGPRTASWPTS